MKDSKLNYTLNVVARWFVGLVFLFSSFVKGVDPMGTSFKIQEYMTAWSLGNFTFEWALPFANLMAIGLIVAEFLVGVLMITGSFRRIGAWLLALMMLFFTCTTFVDALTNKVTDCGCFGDAVKMTNWQTFWKNIVLDVPTVWIFLTQKLRWKKRIERDITVALVAVVVMGIFCLYNVFNEPCIDFRAWKVGNEMMNMDPDVKMESFVSYTNRTTGEVVEVPSSECMQYQQDTLNWAFADSRVVDPHEIRADGFSMLDMEMTDWAVDLIGSPDPLLIVTIHHLDKVSDNGLEAIKSVVRYAEDNDLQVVVLSAALPEEMQAFLYEQGLDNLDFYFADATAIETMARSNPGFVLMKNGRVAGKWHYRKVEKLKDVNLNTEE